MFDSKRRDGDGRANFGFVWGLGVVVAVLAAGCVCGPRAERSHEVSVDSWSLYGDEQPTAPMEEAWVFVESHDGEGAFAPESYDLVVGVPTPSGDGDRRDIRLEEVDGRAMRTPGTHQIADVAESVTLDGRPLDARGRLRVTRAEGPLTKEDGARGGDTAHWVFVVNLRSRASDDEDRILLVDDLRIVRRVEYTEQKCSGLIVPT